MKRIVSGLLAFLLISVSVFTFSIPFTEASGTIYIKADGSIEPPTANITSSDNVTYSFTDNINHSIVVERDNIVVDGAGYTHKGTGTGTEIGLNLTERSNVTIRNMNIQNFTYGIYLHSSSNNRIVENIVVNNENGIILPWQCFNNSIVGNAGGNIYIGHSEVNSIVENNCSWIKLKYAYFNNITRNNCSSISLTYTGWNSLVGNTVTANNGTGISLAMHGPHNSLVGNTVTANNGIGINLDLTWNDISIVGNTVTANNGTGIYIHVCAYINITGNTVRANNGYGIYLSQSVENHSIVGNTIAANNGTGIYLYQSDGNIIYHNNFVNSTKQVYSGDSTNVWDDGYPSGGNYWSDYAGVDLYSGPFQDEPGCDGIWDHPYVIDMTNQDRYPLVSPWPGAEWDVVLAATLEGYQDVCEFGVRNDATPSFDPAYDAVDPPLPPEGVDSYFWYPDNPAIPVDLRRLAKSKIPPCGSMTWTYKVKPVNLEGQTSLSWSPEDIALIPPAYRVLLLDSERIEVADMREVSIYSFTAEMDTPYTFTILVAPCCDFELQLHAGWNMVSFPCIPQNASFSNILGGLGYYQVLTWDGKSYVVPKEAEAGRGYWILVLVDTTVSITDGVPVESYELDLPAGWSMIGSIFPCSVDADLVFPSFYQLLTWDGASYVSSATIELGVGYWALVLESTHIVVDESCCTP